MSNADIFGLGHIGPVVDIGAGERREPVQLLRSGYRGELQHSMRARQAGA